MQPAGSSQHKALALCRAAELSACFSSTKCLPSCECWERGGMGAGAAQGSARGADLTPAAGNTGPVECPVHPLAAPAPEPDPHNHFHQKFPKKSPGTKRSKAAPCCANPPAAQRLDKAAASPSSPAAAAGGTRSPRLVWEQPCNAQGAKGASPAPPTQPRICLTGPRAARHTQSCTFSHRQLCDDHYHHYHH